VEESPGEPDRERIKRSRRKDEEEKEGRNLRKKKGHKVG
jgi:hypothetical protein